MLCIARYLQVKTSLIILLEFHNIILLEFHIYM